MIDFSNIERKSIGYRILYRYVKFVHNVIYYRNYIVVGRENIPKNDDGLLLISNHQNGLNDALGILFAVGKPYPVFIARADIFRWDFVARMLRFLRIMPAFRVVDTGAENLGNNSAIFEKASSLLVEKGRVCLFPEAGHQQCRHLGTFKKGFARIAFRAAEMTNFEKKIWILPMSNHYSNYFSIQSSLVITIGEPFSFEELYDEYKEHPKRAMRLLAQKARYRVENLMLDIKDLNFYEQYDVLRAVNADRRGYREVFLDQALLCDKRLNDDLDYYRDAQPEKFRTLMSEAKEYADGLKQHHFRSWVIGSTDGFWELLLRQITCLITFPTFICCALLNLIPYNACKLITRKVEDKMLHASFNVGLGALITFPLFYILWTLLFLIIFGFSWKLLVFVLSLPATLVVFQYLKVRYLKLHYLCRYYRQKNKSSILRLRELKQSLMEKLTAVEDEL